MRRVVCVGVVVLSLAGPLPAVAGHAQARKGFWGSFGFGYGSAKAQCDQCLAGGRQGSFSGTFRLGGTLGEHWLLGWEGSGWLKNNASGWLPAYEDADRTLGNSSVIALYYPVSSSGLFVKAGAGVSFAGFTYGGCVGDSCSIDEAASGVGFGITAGVGYDLRIRPNMSLTPELSLARGLRRDLSDHGRTVATGWRHDIWALNLCLTFH